MKNKFLKIMILFIVITITINSAQAQFTPAQNAYLNKNELLKNPDAENGATGWISSVKPVIATLDYFSGVASFELQLTNQTLSFCQSVDTSIKLQNAILNGSCRIKTSSNELEICSVINGAVSNCSSISNTGDWEKGSPLDFPTGSSTSGLCIRSSGPITSIVRIDGCSLKEKVDAPTAALGVIPVQNGGTGLNNAGNNGDILISDGTNYVLTPATSLGGLPPYGAQGNVLTSDGTQWYSSPIIDNLQSLNGLSSTQQNIEIGTNGFDFNISSVGDTHTINLPFASPTKAGKISALDWSNFNSKLSGAGASIDGELVLFQGTLGNSFKRATGSGLVNMVHGVYATLPPAANGKVLKSNGTAWVAGDIDASSIPNSNSTTTGLLTFSDWIRFDGAANKPNANASTTGYLSSADWIRFDGVTSKPNASSTATGYLTSTDWIRFDGVVNKPNADSQTTGFLSSIDWVRFDSKANVGEIDLTGTILGVLPLVNGGTGLSTIGANNTVLASNGTSLNYVTFPVELPSANIAGNVLTSNGTNWISSPPVSSGGDEPFNSSDLTLTESDSIAINLTASTQNWVLGGNSSAITMSSTPFGSYIPLDGAQITIIGYNNSNTVSFTHNDISKGVVLNGNVTLKKYGSITFKYNALLDRYVEQTRN